MGRALGELEVTLLYALLALGEGTAGLALRKEVRRRTGRDLSPGAVYTALGRLEERGLVTSMLGEGGAARAGRPVRSYTLLPAGARALSEAYRHVKAMSRGLTEELLAATGEGPNT